MSSRVDRDLDVVADHEPPDAHPVGHRDDRRGGEGDRRQRLDHGAAKEGELGAPASRSGPPSPSAGRAARRSRPPPRPRSRCRKKEPIRGAAASASRLTATPARQGASMSAVFAASSIRSRRWIRAASMPDSVNRRPTPTRIAASAYWPEGQRAGEPGEHQIGREGDRPGSAHSRSRRVRRLEARES